ncbi:hypothetical protein J3P85_03155 [Pseudomonas sp. Z1-12]|uniref:hypothetical protein n=1 Tax=Pseudomonas sp. Z1-12 TaxID=2817408 RepID=UPI003DA95AB2
MKDNLTEQEMREALFGTEPKNLASIEDKPCITSDQQHVSNARRASNPCSPKLKVTLRVMSEFEGNAELLVYEASTLSRIVAEQEAKAEAKKRKFKYFELKKIESV